MRLKISEFYLAIVSVLDIFVGGSLLFLPISFNWLVGFAGAFGFFPMVLTSSDGKHFPSDIIVNYLAFIFVAMAVATVISLLKMKKSPKWKFCLYLFAIANVCTFLYNLGAIATISVGFAVVVAPFLLALQLPNLVFMLLAIKSIRASGKPGKPEMPEPASSY